MTGFTPGSKRTRTKRHRIIRTVSAIAAVATLGLAAACSSDSVTAPQLTRNNGLLGSLVTGAVNTLWSVTGVLRTTSVAVPITRSAVITLAGGHIDIPELGFRLDVPAGALPADSMVISVTALAGRTVAYEFEPHGTNFLKPLTIHQDLPGRLASLLGASPTYVGGYFKNASQVNSNTGAATVNETFTTSLLSNQISFDITHFSGYMVATGKSGTTSDAAPADGM